GQALLASGEPLAIAAILSLHPGPGRTYATFQPQHTEVMRRTFALANNIPMIRMAVSAESFRPEDGRTEMLTGADIRRINALYGSDGGPAFYSPEHIDSGLYRGLIEDGHLVAIAGTHVISRRERVAVVGNVFTHPSYRGRGFARCVTSAVTERLLEICDDVVLTVDPNNTPAVTVYRELGYREAHRLIESSARRLDPIGLKPTLRRIAARWRGRGRRGALVAVPD
ncbi:MAG: GNAT family N-acetyltransferase, partial [Dehalococcoidia bacterium]